MLRLIGEGLTNRQIGAAHGAGREDGEELHQPPAGQARPRAADAGGDPRHRAARPRRAADRLSRAAAAPSSGPRCPTAPAEAVSRPPRRSARSARLASPLRTVTGGSPQPSSVTTTRTSSVDAHGDRHPLGPGVPHDVGDQLAHHRDEVEHEVGRQVLHARRASAGPGAARGPSVTERTTSASRRRTPAGEASSASLQLEDRRADARDRAVEFVHAARRGAAATSGRLGLQGAAEPVQRQRGGEDPLDDVVVQVAGDAVAVGLHLQPALPLLGAGQLQDDGGLRGERRQQVELVGRERLAAARRAGPPAGPGRARCPAGPACAGPYPRGELDDRRPRDGRPPAWC